MFVLEGQGRMCEVPDAAVVGEQEGGAVEPRQDSQLHTEL